MIILVIWVGCGCKWRITVIIMAPLRFVCLYRPAISSDLFIIKERNIPLDSGT